MRKWYVIFNDRSYQFVEAPHMTEAIRIACARAKRRDVIKAYWEQA
jgi:hypothetical protein